MAIASGAAWKLPLPVGGLPAWRLGSQTENEEPHPQVVVALGFLMTNCAPCKSSL